MLKYNTYAGNLRMAAKTKSNAQGRPLSIREIATMSGYSYEQIRKLFSNKHDQNNKLSLSRPCNDVICDILGLDLDDMWRLAEQEKFAQKNGYAPVQLEDPEGLELQEIWNNLDNEQHTMLLQIARQMSVATQVSNR
jgi:hypothetical protein